MWDKQDGVWRFGSIWTRQRYCSKPPPIPVVPLTSFFASFHVHEPSYHLALRLSLNCYRHRCLINISVCRGGDRAQICWSTRVRGTMKGIRAKIKSVTCPISEFFLCLLAQFLCRLSSVTRLSSFVFELNTNVISIFGLIGRIIRKKFYRCTRFYATNVYHDYNFWKRYTCVLCQFQFSYLILFNFFHAFKQNDALWKNDDEIRIL